MPKARSPGQLETLAKAQHSLDSRICHLDSPKTCARLEFQLDESKHQAGSRFILPQKDSWNITEYPGSWGWLWEFSETAPHMAAKLSNYTLRTHMLTHHGPDVRPDPPRPVASMNSWSSASKRCSSTRCFSASRESTGGMRVERASRFATWWHMLICCYWMLLVVI